MTDRPRLLILSFSPLRGDARILKQIAAFSESYEITTCGHGPAPDEVGDHVPIPEDLAIWRYDRALIVTRQYTRAYWSNAAIAYARAALHGRNFDVILANDVDAVGLALSLEPRHGVHADLHEYAPRLHEELLRWRLFVAPFQRWMCRTFVARAASWSTVGHGLADEYERRFGFHPLVVTNAAPFAESRPTPVADPPRLVHSGACLRNRHLATLVEGVRSTRSGVTLDLFLTPNDPPYLEELKELAARSGGRIRVNDPVPYSELNQVLNAYDVGVHILPPVNFNNAWALPNKIFDYVQARLGIIVGPSPEMADYVRQYALGVVTQGFRADDFARVLDDVTVDQVTAWKSASHEHAHALSGERQVGIWKDAVDRLAGIGGAS